MDIEILNAARDLEKEYVEADKNNYTALFLILKRLHDLVNLCDLKIFDESFLHVYRESKILIKYPPSENEKEDTSLINRELFFLVHNVITYLRK